MKHLGDITKINGKLVEPVNVIIGGSPCQDLSVAGKRAGLAGERSGLFMEQLRVTIVAMVLTLAAFFAYCQIKAVPVVWYMVAAAVVLGFFVAYAAMFGFDKLKEVIMQLKSKKE